MKFVRKIPYKNTANIIVNKVILDIWELFIGFSFYFATAKSHLAYYTRLF